MIAKYVFTVVGLAVALVGLAIVVEPSIAAGLGASRVGLYVVGFGAAVMAVDVVQRRRRREPTQADTPDPEVRGHLLARPGEDLDWWLATESELADRPNREREEPPRPGQLEDRLASVAIDVVQHRDGCTREEAKRSLVHGTWTDDPLARAYFVPGSPDLPPRSYVRAVLSNESSAVLQARHAVSELAGDAPRGKT